MDVIYVRYSTEMQNPKSCRDQERDVREGLARKGLDPSTFLLLADHAESGTNDDRPAFQRVLELMRAKKLRTLAVDDQARFSRGDDAYAMVKDLVFVGGRFISTTEGIDTNEKGWELRVKVTEMHHSATIGNLGNLVRRGQRGRVLGGLTTVDYAFGYESF
ncbi:MAG: recombinase family protein [Candidatus Saccharimonadales bacterium]